MAAKSSSTSQARRRTNNNPAGHNQYTGSIKHASDHPLVTAAVVTGAAAAELFLRSRRIGSPITGFGGGCSARTHAFHGM